MKITVNEIISMIESGKLNTMQSTQRPFLYAETHINGGSISKAADVIKSILEYGIQLPAIYFWHNTDTKKTNLHDGKQRVLSIYYFLHPEKYTGNQISTEIGGKTLTVDGLTTQQRNNLENYTFDVVEREGNSTEEEDSFYRINMSGLPLTKWECISGQCYGRYLTEFADYIDKLSDTNDFIKKISLDRGNQAYRLLMTINQVTDYRKLYSDSDKQISSIVSKKRNYPFDPNVDHAGDILDFYTKFCKLTGTKKDETILSVAKYVVFDKHYNINELLKVYEKVLSERNDIEKKWDIKIHKEFINAYFERKDEFGNNLILDGKRFFEDWQKDKLISNMNERGEEIACKVCGDKNYSHLSVDHIKRWANGGRTELDNAQLLCKTHNSSKG